MSTKGDFLKNKGFLFLVNILIKPIWILVIDKELQLRLNEETYGIYLKFLYVAYIAGFLLEVGLHQYATVFLANCAPNSDLWREKTREFFSIKVLYTFLYWIGVILFYFLNSESVSFWIYSLIFMQIYLFSWLQFFRIFLQSSHNYRIDAYFSSIDRIFLLIFGGLTLYGVSSLNLIKYNGLFILSYCLSIGLIWKTIRRLGLWENPVLMRPSSWSFLREFSPYIFVQFLMIIFYRIDLILIDRIIPNAALEIGKYAYSIRLIDSMHNLIYLLSVFLLPFAAKQIAANKTKVLFQLSLLLTGIFFLCAAIFCILMYYYGDTLLNLIYNQGQIKIDTYILKLFQLHIFSTIGLGLIYIHGTILIALKRFSWLIFSIALPTLGLISLNFIFIPSYHAIASVSIASSMTILMGLLKMIGSLYYLSKTKN
ncbi:MAG: hypothetical protein MUE53_03485 [Chitinophagales bacterium]|jgi:O-antigen/teichoic acid export membrane protein|nr:hypothetical protein [Chitinophagales bacterium]